MSRFAFLDRHGRPVVWGMAALYVAVYFSICLTKLRYYLYTDFDLALFTQAAHQITRGSLWNSIRGMNWIGDHSSLVLFLLAPLQLVWPGPASMLFVQTALLALGAVAAWKLARHEGLAEPAPTLFAALWLLHPAIGYTNLFEFHPEVLSTSALLFAFLALRTGSRRALVLWTAFALLGKEDVALPVFMMGLYALTLRRPGSRVDAALLGGLAVASLAVTFLWLKPAFNQGDVDYGDMYIRLGRTTTERVAYVLVRPVEVFATLFSSPGDPVATSIKWAYYLHLLGPLLFLPLFAPLALLIAGPTLAEHMLSNRSPQHSIVFQYTALVTPIVMAAAILGAKSITAWLAARPARTPKAAEPRALASAIAAAALMGSLGCNLWIGPLRGRHDAMTVKPLEATAPNARERTLKPIRDRLASRVPAEGGVVASFPFMPGLATRAAVHSAHHIIRGRFTYSRRLFPIPSGVAAFLADMSSPTLLPYQGPTSPDRMQDLFARNGLRPVEAIGDHLLYLANARDTVELVTPGASPPDVAQDWTLDGELQCAGFDSVEAVVAAGEELKFRTFWRRTGVARKLYLMDLLLVDPSGAIRARHVRPLGYGVSSTALWPSGESVREQGRWILPLDTPPGDYALAIAIRWRFDRSLEAGAPESAADPRVVPIGLVTVTAPRAANRPPAPR